MTYNFKFDDLITISAKSTNFMFVPIAENNVKKIRVYIKTDKLDKDSLFQSVYTYYVSIQELADIIIMAHETNSLGKTYNALIRNKLKGCGFSGKGHRRKGYPASAHKVNGKFHYRNCIIEANNYGADNLFEQVNTYLNNLKPTPTVQEDDLDNDDIRQSEIDKFFEELYNY